MYRKHREQVLCPHKDLDEHEQEVVSPHPNEFANDITENIETPPSWDTFQRQSFQVHS